MRNLVGSAMSGNDITYIVAARGNVKIKTFSHCEVALREIAAASPVRHNGIIEVCVIASKARRFRQP